MVSNVNETIDLVKSKEKLKQVENQIKDFQIKDVNQEKIHEDEDEDKKSYNSKSKSLSDKDAFEIQEKNLFNYKQKSSSIKLSLEAKKIFWNANQIRDIKEKFRMGYAAIKKKEEDFFKLLEDLIEAAKKEEILYCFSYISFKVIFLKTRKISHFISLN